MDEPNVDDQFLDTVDAMVLDALARIEAGARDGNFLLKGGPRTLRTFCVGSIPMS